MELFGAKFNVTLGVWRLRFVLMLEEPEVLEQSKRRGRTPHHISAVRDASHAR